MRGLGLDAVASHDVLADRIRRKLMRGYFVQDWFWHRCGNANRTPDDAFADHRGRGLGFPQERDPEKARYACEGNTEFITRAFADMEIQSDFVADAHAVSKYSAVVERFETNRLIVFERKYAVRETDLNFSVRAHERLL